MTDRHVHTMRRAFRIARAALYNIAFVLGRSAKRMHASRADFLRILPHGSIGAELGVFKGEFSEAILRLLRPRKLYLVDPWWEAYGEFYPDWGPYTNEGRLTTKAAHDNVMQVVGQWRDQSKVVVHVGFDVPFLHDLPDHHLNWVYIDTSHEYEHTRAELDVLNRKVRLDGLITGDDWQPDPTHIHHGVARAVQEFCALHDWYVFRLDNFGQWAIKRRAESA